MSVKIPQKRKTLDKTHLRRIYKERVYHALLSVIILIAIAQVFTSIGINAIKLASLNNQINELRELNAGATEKNIQLKEQLRIYSSYKGIEELARNNLKMVGKDEVLVLIRKSPDTSE